MSATSFERLACLREDLARVAIAAEKAITTPKYCLLELRDWLERVLNFLEKYYYIPHPPPVDELARLNQGPLQHRIHRLPEYLGGAISDNEIGALHKLRISGNWAAHPEKNEHNLTGHNAELALANARRIADWLYQRHADQIDEEERCIASDTKSGSWHSADPETDLSAKAHPVLTETRFDFVASDIPIHKESHSEHRSTFSSDTKPPRVPLAKTFVLGVSILVLVGLILLRIDDLTAPQSAVSSAIGGMATQPAPLAQLKYDGTQLARLNYDYIGVMVDSARLDAYGPLPVATGRYRDRVVFSVEMKEIERTHPMATASVWHLDQTSPLPAVLVSYYSGGAHCCTFTVIAVPASVGNWSLVDAGKLDGGGYEFYDLSRDGTIELVDVDNRFLYAFGCYACSYAPTRVHSLVEGKLKDVTREPRYQGFLRQRLVVMEQRAGQNNSAQRNNGYLGGWVAAKAQVGELDDAWRTMLASYDRNADWGLAQCASGEALNKCRSNNRRKLDFPSALAKVLLEGGYATVDQVKRLPSVALSAAFRGPRP